MLLQSFHQTFYDAKVAARGESVQFGEAAVLALANGFVVVADEGLIEALAAVPEFVSIAFEARDGADI